MENIKRPYLIAGPCSVESHEQLLNVSKALCAVPNVQLIRAGVWKPRTRPGGFEGLGEQALQWMRQIANSPLRMADGAPVNYCCEVARPEHVELCLQYGISHVWIGARTTVNPFMVEEICQSLRGTGISVMVKNPASPDLGLWIGAIERLMQSGITDIKAIHRGFTTYNPRTLPQSNGPHYRNQPLWEIPISLHREMPDIPILCDPSHIGGSRELVAPLCLAAMLIDFDGLMIEVHPDPATAWTDANQQITPDALVRIVGGLNLQQPAGTPDAEHQLAPLRDSIDTIDHQLVGLLAERMELSRKIADIKRQCHMPVFQSQRWQSVLHDRLVQATAIGLDASFMRELLEKIHAESVRVQLEGQSST